MRKIEMGADRNCQPPKAFIIVGYSLANQIFLSADSILKYFTVQPVELKFDLPVVGSVVLDVKELQFNSGRIGLPIHHKIPLIPDFDISLEAFECHGTGISFEIGKIGIISGSALHLLNQAFAGTIAEKLGGSNVRLEDNRICLEASSFLPKEFRDFRLTQLQIAEGSGAGIRIEFEF